MAMKPKNILVPTDLSESATAALHEGRDLAASFDATLHVLQVIEYPWRNGPASELCGQKERAGLERLKGLFGASGERRVIFACRVGTPLIEIIEYASTHDIDLIVMGTHQRLPTPQMLSPSVTENIVRQAPCPVLVVQAQQAHELAA
jgi:nucleotide-binding universal stress UspA family protein